MEFPNEGFTSATVIRDSIMPPHKDVFNDRDSFNLVSPLQVPRGAGVRQQMTTGDENQESFWCRTSMGGKFQDKCFP